MAIRLLLAVASLVAEHGFQVHRLQDLCVGSVDAACGLWSTGLVATSPPVGTSRTRDQTSVSCIGR